MIPGLDSRELWMLIYIVFLCCLGAFINYNKHKLSQGLEMKTPSLIFKLSCALAMGIFLWSVWDSGNIISHEDAAIAILAPVIGTGVASFFTGAGVEKYVTPYALEKMGR